MSIQHKKFTELHDISLSAKETALKLKNDMFQTQQGLNLNEYELFKNINDVKNKNYSINLLSDSKQIESFIDNTERDNSDIAFTSRLAFNGANTLSSSSVLSFVKNSKVEVSQTNFVSINEKFDTDYTINFIDDEFCTVKVNMDSVDKFLTFNTDPGVDLRGLNNVTISLSNHLFNYSFDKPNGFLQLSKTHNSKKYILAPAASLSAVEASWIGLQSDAASISNSSIIKTIDYDINDNLKYNTINNFIFHDINNFNKTQSISVTGDKSNYVSYFLPENFELEDGVFKNELRFFNTQNQISNNYNVNSLLPFKDTTQQRKYNNILNLETKEKSVENLKLGYTFYTKEYEFQPDKYTKFTLHEDIFPYSRLNVNDSNLSDNGAFAGSSPYFSDKIFKVQVSDDININETSKEIPLIRESNDFNIILEQGGRILLNFLSDQFTNDGSILCSWLSGNNYEKGVWYDRYYYPRKTNYTTALTGSTTQSFEHISLAKQFFESNGIKDTYYDVKSNLTFEPKKTYFYQRIGNNYIKNVLNARDDKLLKNTFNLTFTGKKLDTDIFNLNDPAFDKFNLFNTEKSFSVSFDVSQDGLSSLDTFNLLGNYYKDGISLLNNFYFTPFCIIPQGNELYFFDREFNLLKKNTYPELSAGDIHNVGIKDVLFLEQNNNIAIIGDNKVILTSFMGDKIDEITDNDFSDDLSQYRDRIVSGYNKAYILKNNSNSTLFTDGLIELNLNNLTFSGADSSAFSTVSSIVQTSSGIKGLQGFKGKQLTDNVGVSLNRNNNIIFFDNFDGSTFSNPICAINSHIYDINTYENELFVQTFNTSTNKGEIRRYNSERSLLSTYNLNVSAVSGFSLEFMSDNREVKLLSFSKRSDQFLTVDKFNLNNALSSTFNLPISSVILSGGDINGVKSNNVNIVGFNNLYTKYKDIQGKFHLKTNFDSFNKLKLQKDSWSVTSLVQNNSAWNIPSGEDPNNVMQWNTFFLTSSGEEEINQEIFTNIDIGNKIKFNLLLNFHLDDGIIDVYIDGERINQISFPSNIKSIDRLLYPDLYFNIPLVDNEPVTKILNNNDFYSSGASISNLRIYSDYLSKDFIKFVTLDRDNIDKLVFDIPCGMRNNYEEFDNLYSYNVPGFKNNTLKIYIRNAEINENSKEKLIDFLTSKLTNALPANIDKIVYDLDINYNK